MIVGPAGNPIPAQRIKTVYYLDADGRLAKAVDIPGPLYVNHYETCPRAADFHDHQRARGRGGQQRAEGSEPR